MTNIKEEFDLSEKEFGIHGAISKKLIGDAFLKQDVKEFIRLFKDWLSEQDVDHLSSLTVYNQINKLAGEKLCQ